MLITNSIWSDSIPLIGLIWVCFRSRPPRSDCWIFMFGPPNTCICRFRKVYCTKLCMFSITKLATFVLALGLLYSNTKRNRIARVLFFPSSVRRNDVWEKSFIKKKDQQGMNKNFYYPLKGIMLQNSSKTNGVEFIPFYVCWPLCSFHTTRMYILYQYTYTVIVYNICTYTIDELRVLYSERSCIQRARYAP